MVLSSEVVGVNNWPLLIAKAVILLCSFPIHECAHAWLAAKLGDHTAERAGRITLNPFKHLDLWGTILLIAFGVGYAKPVPVNNYNFRQPKRDSALVALAGPMSNLIMAIILLTAEHAVYRTAGRSGYGTVLAFISYCLRYASYINIALTIINLIPLPPLDGYHVVSVLAPDRLYYRLSWFEQHSIYMILGMLLVFTLMGVSPVVSVARKLFSVVDGLCGLLFQS